MTTAIYLLNWRKQLNIHLLKKFHGSVSSATHKLTLTLRTRSVYIRDTLLYTLIKKLHLQHKYIQEKERKKKTNKSHCHFFSALISLPLSKSTLVQIHPPPAANTSLAACSPSHLPSPICSDSSKVYTAPPCLLSFTHTDTHMALYSISHLSLHNRRAYAHAHTHSVHWLFSSPTPLHPTIHPTIHPSIHPSIHPTIPLSCGVCWCDNSWLIHLWFPSSLIPNTHTHKKILANRRDSFVMITLNWFPDLLHSVATGGGENEETGKKVEKEKEMGKKGLIKSLSADVSL